MFDRQECLSYPSTNESLSDIIPSMYEFAVAPAVTSIRRRGVEIAGVSPDSLGFELELESGDRIIKVNGRAVRDYLDFRFHTAGETELVMEVRKNTGEDW